MISRSTDIKYALRSRQRGFLLNPYRFGGASNPGTGPLWNAMTLSTSEGGPVEYLGNSTFVCIRSATTNIVSRSTNGGQTWANITLPGSSELRRISSDGAGKAIISCGGSGTSQAYYYTSDYGATWTAGTMPVSQFWYVNTYSNGVWLMAVYSGAIYTSTNMTTWTSRTGGTNSQRGALGNNSTNFYIWIDASAIGKRSTDSGATWANSGALPVAGSTQQSAAYTGSRMTLFNSAGNGRSYSDDFGTTWAANAALPSGAVCSTGPRYSPTLGGYLLAADNNTSNKMIVSTDGGNTWAFCTNTRLSTTVCWIATDGAGRWVYCPNTGTSINAGGYADL